MTVLVRVVAAYTTDGTVATEVIVAISGACCLGELGDFVSDVLQACEPDERKILIQRTGPLQNIAAPRCPRIVSQEGCLVPCEAIAARKEKKKDWCVSAGQPYRKNGSPKVTLLNTFIQSVVVSYLDMI